MLTLDSRVFNTIHYKETVVELTKHVRIKVS